MNGWMVMVMFMVIIQSFIDYLIQSCLNRNLLLNLFDESLFFVSILMDAYGAHFTVNVWIEIIVKDFLFYSF